ncbi:MAG: hypothetical protein ACHQFX_06665 [Chitinophagales bacterium]
MKSITITILFFMLFCNAFADNFQILYREGNNTYSVSYSSFRILDQSNKVVVSGYTDKYGRIAANLVMGNYVCEITYSKTIYRKPITIDGSTNLKDILL